jgi:hypothetical protein
MAVHGAMPSRMHPAKYHGAGAVGGAHRQIQAEGHLDLIHGIGPDEPVKKRSQEKQSDGVHGEGFDGPVDEQGQKYRLAAFTGLDDLAKIDLHHDGVHHEKEAEGDGDGDHRCAVDIDRHAVQGAGHAGGDFSHQDADENTQQHPHGEIALENAGHFAVVANNGVLVHMLIGS